MDAVRTPLAGIGFAFLVLLAEAFVGRAFVREADIAEDHTHCTNISSEEPVVDLSAWDTQASRNYTLQDL